MKNMKQEIQMHLDKARMLAAELGMELEDFINGKGEEEGEEEGGMEEGGEEEEGPMAGPGPNRGKIALIVAKMKKAKGE